MWNDLVRDTPSRPHCCPRKRSNVSLRVEQLEDRVVPAVDPILEWSKVAMTAQAVDHSSSVVAPSQGGPTRTSRALAIVHAAMFDAFNSITRRFTPYLTQAPNAKRASVDAAVAQAAHDTLAALYPNQAASFDAFLTQTLRRVRDGAKETRGVAVGAFVADRILEARANDGASNNTPYTPGTTPGSHNVDPLHPGQGFLSPNWGSVTPFTMSDVDDFPTPPPPALDSAEYTAAFNQVMMLGGDGTGTPTQRTQEQTFIGQYWGYDGSPGMGVPPLLYNEIAQVIAAAQDNTVADNARLFALINLAMADAGIQAWGVKYEFNFWRPVLGLRGGDTDGNPLTDGDPTWSPLGAPRTNGFAGETNFTPPFPAYTSGHATFGASAFKTLANFYRTDDLAFTFVSAELNGMSHDQNGLARALRPRSFDSLSEAAAENAASRIFLGIHWRFDATEGISAGNRIADFAFENFLRPRGGRAPRAIANSDFVAQVDAVLSGGVAAPLASSAPPTASLSGSTVVQTLLTRSATATSTGLELTPVTATRTGEQPNLLVSRLQRLSGADQTSRPGAAEFADTQARDTVFGSGVLDNGLGDLL